mmetsp:Transcript_4543/g.11247  ORF Transcript_4543/g.11247 Transcript_4543/m.11247 type:complete len:288 (-) Transcript_4543:684-1547(-)
MKCGMGPCCLPASCAAACSASRPLRARRGMAGMAPLGVPAPLPPVLLPEPSLSRRAESLLTGACAARPLATVGDVMTCTSVTTSPLSSLMSWLPPALLCRLPLPPAGASGAPLNMRFMAVNDLPMADANDMPPACVVKERKEEGPRPAASRSSASLRTAFQLASTMPSTSTSGGSWLSSSATRCASVADSLTYGLNSSTRYAAAQHSSTTSTTMWMVDCSLNVASASVWYVSASMASAERVSSRTTSHTNCQRLDCGVMSARSSCPAYVPSWIRRRTMGSMPLLEIS